MKKYLIILAIISVFIGCSKDGQSPIQNDNDNESRDGGGTVFFYNGQVIDSSQINWNSDTLNIVIGIHGLDTILTFGNDASLINWANTCDQEDFFLDLLSLKDTALIVADALDEFDYLETYGEHSREYQAFLDSFLHDRSRAGTILFEHNNYLGDYQNYISTLAYVGNKMNNKASSMQFAAIGGMLADYKWWGGRKFWYWTLALAGHPSMPNYNDKATSILIY